MASLDIIFKEPLLAISDAPDDVEMLPLDRPLFVFRFILPEAVAAIKAAPVEITKRPPCTGLRPAATTIVWPDELPLPPEISIFLDCAEAAVETKRSPLLSTAFEDIRLVAPVEPDCTLWVCNATKPEVPCSVLPDIRVVSPPFVSPAPETNTTRLAVVIDSPLATEILEEDCSDSPVCKIISPDILSVVAETARTEPEDIAFSDDNCNAPDLIPSPLVTFTEPPF